MEKKYFSSLEKIEKIDFILNYGEIIHEIQTHSTYKSLFILNGFFVEVYLDKLSNEIRSIYVQENTEELYKYVQHIALDIFQHG